MTDTRARAAAEEWITKHDGRVISKLAGNDKLMVTSLELLLTDAVEKALVQDRIERHDETVAAIERAVARAVKDLDKLILKRESEIRAEEKITAEQAEEIARLQERLDAHAEIVAEAVAAERERLRQIADRALEAPGRQRYECCRQPVAGYPFCPEHGGDPEKAP